MKKNIIIYIIIVISIIGIFLIGYNMGKFTAYSANKEYYNHTEALLDSICSWDESFRDTVMETDIYYEYELARDNYNK